MRMMVIIRRFVERLMITKSGTKGLIREDLHFNIFVVGYVTYSKDCRFRMKMEKSVIEKDHISTSILFYHLPNLYSSLSA